MANMKYTISDIAKLARVGVGTVSRVINDDPRVKAETRLRVQKVIERVGYQPNFAARYIRTKRSSIIGVIADQVATTPFAGNIIKGAQAAAWAANKVLILIDSDGNFDLRVRAVNILLERDVEGIIYAAHFHQEVFLPEDIYKVPTVLVDCFVGERNLPSVVPDEFRGGYEATETLIRQGHRHIGLINLEPLDNGYPAEVLRYQGYCAALKDYDIPYRESYVRYGSEAGNGYRFANELLDAHSEITCFFVGNDRTAMGVYDAVKGRGLAIPQDIALISFDNQEILAENLHPQLSSMALPHAAMGEWAVEYLHHHQSEDMSSDGSTIQQLMHCPLVARQSH